MPLITIMTMTPLVGALVVMAMRTDRVDLVRGVGLAFSFLTLILAMVLWGQFQTDTPLVQFVERHAWIPSIQVDYYVGVDGLGLLMVMLSALIVPFALFASTIDTS